MATILHIETSTNVCSVALSNDQNIVFEKYTLEGPSHAANLGLFVEEALNTLKAENLILNAVAVSSGPGSYTGLRIGVSMAKGLCFGYDVPLLAIPTLKLLASQMISYQQPVVADYYCPMIDARRMEVYATIYNPQLQEVRETVADIVTEETYLSWLEKGTVCFFGNGAAKCKEVIHSPNAIFVDQIYPLASGMIPLAITAYNAGQWEDKAYFDPFYLKEFVATIAKNKVLGEQK